MRSILYVYFVVLLCSVSAIHDATFYTAAVLEHVKEDDPRDRTGAINRNLGVFEDAANEAASLGADIIVFPEVAIMPSRMMTKRTMKEFYEEIPKQYSSLSWNPCGEAASNQCDRYKADHPVLTRLSCIAQHARIYVVANIGEREPCSPLNDTRCPSGLETLFYNTDVVFDSNGTLVARHRKRFPFFETHITRPKSPEFTSFNTSFGSFGVIICFDSIFEEAVELVEKYKVDNMIISTMWFDELPFLSAVQYFQGWALGNKVNVLAANIHQPRTGTIGSLLVSGFQGTLKYSFKPMNRKSELLVARIPRSRKYVNTGSTGATLPLDGYNHNNADFSNYTLKRLEEKSASLEVCNNGLCCHLNYSSKSVPENFHLAAFNGIRNVNNHYFFCQEVCVLTLCADGDTCKNFPTHSEVAFESISLEGNIQTPHQYPSVLASDMILVPYTNWEFKHGSISIQSGMVQDPILSVSIHGRCYDRDPPFPNA